MKENMKILMVALAAGMFSAIVVLGASAIADSNPATDQTPKLIPYHGTLEKDGHGLNGAVKLHFRVFDGKAATKPVWDEILDVTAYNGKFTALLGSSDTAHAQDLTKVITDADDLYLGVSIVKADSTEIALSNRQRFLPVPYAMWTTASTDFKVGHDLNVGNDLSVNGTDVKFGKSPGRGDGGRAMVHDYNDTLVVNYKGDFSGGTRVDSKMEVNGDLTINGNVEVNQTDNKFKLVFMKKIVMQQEMYKSTGLPTNYWNCIIGGLDYGDGDIDEGPANGSHIIMAYTYPKDGQWWVSADFKSKYTHEPHTIGVVCFRIGISTISKQYGWFSEPK